MYRVFIERARHIIITSLFFLSVQEVKAAILVDMVQLGKEGGLKSFEQVQHS